MPFSTVAAPVTPLLVSMGVGGQCPRSGSASSPLWSALGATAKSLEHTVHVPHGPSWIPHALLGVSLLQAPVCGGRAPRNLIHTYASVAGYPFRLI